MLRIFRLEALYALRKGATKLAAKHAQATRDAPLRARHIVTHHRTKSTSAAYKMDEKVGIPSVDLSSPLSASYTYHSPRLTAKGPYILGVDEAGRGPVLGPLVYGVAYCPASYQEDLDKLGFAGTSHNLVRIAGRVCLTA